MIPENEWEWSSLKNVGFGVEFWPLTWWPLWDFYRGDDYAGGTARVRLGPFDFVFHYNRGWD